ncbi:MAG: serine--tRNA ligase, partial [Alistipes sp.]|nr:serine--tRNA ligase [Alistipes sp.]
MLTLKQLRENKEEAIRRLQKKGVDAAPIIARIEELDDKRKALQIELDNCLAAQNAAAKQIGALMAKGEKEAAEAKKAEVAGLKTRSQQLKEEADRAAVELQNEIVLLPNMPADIVPEGRRAEDNVVVKLVERENTLSGEALPHWELAKKYDIIDFDLGVKLTGAGFP